MMNQYRPRPWCAGAGIEGEGLTHVLEKVVMHPQIGSGVSGFDSVVDDPLDRVSDDLQFPAGPTRPTGERVETVVHIVIAQDPPQTCSHDNTEAIVFRSQPTLKPP